MAINLSSISKSAALKAPRIVLYGVPGIGKTTTFAAQAPNPIFIQTEDGLGSLDVPHFPLAKSVDDVRQAIAALKNEDHDYQTVVLDSADHLELLVAEEVESKHDAKDLAYGKGAVIQQAVWKELLGGLNDLRNDKGMVVIILSHSNIKRFDSPETEPYDRYVMKLSEKSGAYLREWADSVLFCNYKTIVKSSDVGFNAKVTRGVSSGERLIFTAETPAYIAKNRYSLPA